MLQGNRARYGLSAALVAITAATVLAAITSVSASVSNTAGDTTVTVTRSGSGDTGT